MEQKQEFKEEEFLKELKQHIGTYYYYKFNLFSKMVLTDGVKYLADSLNCYWLMDIVAGVEYRPLIRQQKNFIVWKIEVSENNNFKVTAWSDTPYHTDSKRLYTQKGLYTDFKLKDFEFYQEDNVILLKG